MRNLLSFVLGVLSRLLYVCLRLILLLDRAVCFVRDLPVRRHIAALFRAAGRHRAVCAAVVFVPLFVLPGLLLTRSGMLILADGQPGMPCSSRTVGCGPAPPAVYSTDSSRPRLPGIRMPCTSGRNGLSP